MKTAHYFESTRLREDLAGILTEWISRVVDRPAHQAVQEDGRIRRWTAIEEAGGRFLRVVLLPDGETVHNAFFDRRFTP